MRYRSLVADSQRWDDFVLRPRDIIVTTPPKCGTTWTQMICALLVLQTPDLPAPLSRLSPWIDMTTRSRRQVFADLAAQDHRRFVKTHTPLDGLPVDRAVTYVCVARDPRDAGISMQHHRDNLDLAHVLQAQAEAAADDGITLEPPVPQPPRPDDLAGRFWQWVEEDAEPTEAGSSLRYTLHHLASYRRAPTDLDVVWLHYDELLADLPGQMRSLAERLEIPVAQERWPTLVEAATLSSMREHASVTVPGSAAGQWRDPARFFRQGSSRQWEAVLDGPDDLARYADRARSLASDELVEWVHRPRLP